MPLALSRLFKDLRAMDWWKGYSWNPAIFPNTAFTLLLYQTGAGNFRRVIFFFFFFLPRGPRYSDTSLNYYLMIDSSHWNQRWIHGSRGEISLGKSTKRDRWAFIHHAEVKLLHKIITLTVYIYLQVTCNASPIR